jgi:hypothetical protein
MKIWGLVAVALVAAVTAIATPAQAASSKPWFWSTGRAEGIARYVEAQPKDCQWKIARGWIGHCIAPTYSGFDCLGIGPRIIHDVYLYKTFKCEFTTTVWTPTRIRNNRKGVLVPDRDCADAGELPGPSGTPSLCGQRRVVEPGQGGVNGTGTLRLEVLNRFSAKLTWLGRSSAWTIVPDDGSGNLRPVAK